VIKLAGEALATKSKDLQVAAWLTEAMLRKEGFQGLKAGLELIQGLIETFWDTLYPELDDGDAEMRAAPLEWLGTRMDSALRSVPLTSQGATWFQFKESRVVGYEAAADTDTKVEARNTAIAEGKTSGEEWDAAVAATRRRFMRGWRRPSTAFWKCWRASTRWARRSSATSRHRSVPCGHAGGDPAHGPRVAAEEAGA